MKRIVLLSTAALAGCVLPARAGRDDVFVTQGIAREGSFSCAGIAVEGMGYHLTGYDRAGGSIRADRYLGRYGDDTFRGYLTVAVTQDTAPGQLIVRAERYAESTGAPVPTAYPPSTPPGLPRPTTRSLSRPNARRVSPGEVAGDARVVVRRCAAGGETESTD